MIELISYITRRYIYRVGIIVNRYSAIWSNSAIRVSIYSAIWSKIWSFGFVLIQAPGFGRMDMFAVEIERGGIFRHSPFYISVLSFWRLDLAYVLHLVS